MSAGFAYACALVRTAASSRLRRSNLPASYTGGLALAIAQPELLILHMQALATDLEQACGLGHVAAGLVEGFDDQLALDARGLGSDHLFERSRQLGLVVELAEHRHWLRLGGWLVRGRRELKVLA